MHGPAAKLEKDYASQFKQSLGIKLFIVYALIYAGFVAITTIQPEVLEKDIFLGLNLAVVYGMGLIILAIVMGLIYHFICSKKEDEMTAAANAEQSDKEETE